MPARDLFHDTVRRALVKDGWIITHDPLRLSWGGKDMYVDLGAERLLAAEKEGHRIAVEVKSFIGASLIADLEHALGQYVLYHDIMERLEPERTLYLAVRNEVFLDLFDEPVGRVLLEKERVRLLVFDVKTETVLKWIP